MQKIKSNFFNLSMQTPQSNIKILVKDKCNFRFLIRFEIFAGTGTLSGSKLIDYRPKEASFRESVTRKAGSFFFKKNKRNGHTLFRSKARNSFRVSFPWMKEVLASH